MKKFNNRKWEIGFLVIFIAATLLAVTSHAYAFRFVVLADSPDSETNQAGFNKNCLEFIRGQILKLNPKPDMIFFLGDLVTMSHDTSGHAFIPDWQNTMKPLAQAGIKIYVAVGNRDLYPANVPVPSPQIEEQFRTFFSQPPYFDMPGNGPDNPYNYQKLAYSVSHKNAFFVVLDTFAFKPDGSNWNNGLDTQQLDWLESQAAQSTQTFKFVLSHGPAFSPEGNSVHVDSSLPKNMWSIMQTYNFDAYFCGHEHIYSRWIINKTVDPTITRNVTQVITGGAGALPDQIFKVKESRQKVHAFSLYNYVVGDVSNARVKFSSYGIDLDAGKYSTRLIDQFYFVK